MYQKTAVFISARIASVLTLTSTDKMKPSTKGFSKTVKLTRWFFDKGYVNYKHDNLDQYIPMLVCNWLRKDSRLNGGVRYQAPRLRRR